ncbi:MAG: 5-methylcytosine-specific restriction endonuclease system specificity protein McrC [Clostridia bacterium]|nr:5-methylcytosine-specific restriction endonuclease system specificity protein McrC [Clostridia bacterium]
MIPIRNIYYMLSYAFQILTEKGYKHLQTEQFDNVADLCAAILQRGVSLQLKRGLRREYIEKVEALSSLRGRIDVSESIKTQSIIKKQMYCFYDDFSENSYLNRIIKSTMTLLLKSDISKSRKKELRKLLVFFGNVDALDIYTINWKIQYNRNNQTYRLLVSICYLVVKGLLQTNASGAMQLMDFNDQHMSRLYEKFLLEYYKKEFKQLRVSASQISWALDDGVDEMLPIMQTDIMLEKGDKTLIIDAKYYTHTTQSQFDSRTIHSNNLYQIFTYVKNKEAALANVPHEVSGMLLYAKTDETVQPNNRYLMSGNKITVRTLDLNCDFTEIKTQLNEIANQHFFE